MYRREKLTKQKLDSKKIIDMIVRLYILMIRTESDEVQKEVNILYTLLENLFLSEDISWETYVREIKQAPSNLKDVISFLNKSLITLDKIRIILSLIVLANSDNDLETSEVTRILELAKSFKLEPTTFMEIINSLEFDSEKTVSMPGFRFFSHTQRSIFKDYLSVGTRNENDVQFKDSKVSIDEVLILKIESYFFIGTSSTCSSYLNGKRLEPRKIYTFPDKSILQIGNEFFDYTHLERIYESQFVDDVIQFKKSTYSFDVYNRKNNYSVNVHSGKVYLNGKELPYNREIKLHFNDVIQIKGYDPFKILTIIEQREVIGTETLVPDNLFINADSGNYSISQQETQQTIVTLVRIEDSYILKPPLKRGFDLFLNNKRVLEETNFRVNRDTLTINKNNFRINNLYDLVEVPFEIDYINILDIKHHYADGQLALDGISLEAQKGELIAIMGPSGCGKSTFVKAISAQIIPKYGSIFLDGKDLYSNLGYFSQYIGYIPQEDLLYSELTVYENLYYRGRLRMPQLPKDRLDQKIANILMQTKLTHCRNTRVGAETQLLLSGGERKRLNLALELLFEPQIVICDEPTSGLSSSDSEKIVEILKGLTQQGRIVLVTIHQPNPNLFEQFDRILLMDNGGKQVYYGGTREVFAYFDTELSLANHYVEALNRKKKLMMPDYLFDMIEYPTFKKNGEVVYEQVDRSFAVKRKFTPEYWRNKFKKKLLLDLMTLDTKEEAKENVKVTRSKKKLNLRAHYVQILSFITRNVLLKFRNRSNILITFFEAPLLAIVIGFILRLSLLNDTYSYHTNTNAPIYIFISIIVFLFLGLSNSIEDIMGDKRAILREKKLNIKISYFLSSKVIALSIFSIIQVVLYDFIGSLILGIKGVHIANMTYLFLSSLIGYSLGLLISSFLNNSKALTNILPIILIPQIIFGGAIIQYEKMNKNLKVMKRSPIPEIVQLIPSRWLFEGMFVAQTTHNTRNAKLSDIEKKKLTLVNDNKKGFITRKKYLNRLYGIYDEIKEVGERYPKNIYTNSDIEFAVNIVEGKFHNENKNFFLSPYKLILNKRFATADINILICLLYAMLLNLATYIRLKYYFND